VEKKPVNKSKERYMYEKRPMKSEKRNLQACQQRRTCMKRDLAKLKKGSKKMFKGTNEYGNTILRSGLKPFSCCRLLYRSKRIDSHLAR